MRHLLAIIFMLLVLGAVVSGCRNTPRYDGRLAAADSLMRGDADSALALLEALPLSDLHSAGDSAYRDLLLTQARYRAYVTATSDSDINRALAYYRARPAEREKLTRAYIYKGAVMEELGHPDSAMYYYKTAEATVAGNDYVNLGQINIRIGALYRVYYADFEICYEKYENALKYYRAIDDKAMQQTCLYNMGVCSGITHTGDNVKLLEKALALAVDLEDRSRQYNCKELICRQMLKNTANLPKAKRLAMDCFSNYKEYQNNDLRLDLAEIYVKEGKIDSARFFIGLVNDESSPYEKDQIGYRKCEILSKIARCEGNPSLSGRYMDTAHIMSSKIVDNKMKYSIKHIENQHNKRGLKKKVEEISVLRLSIIAIAIIFIAVLFVIVGLFLRKIHRMKAINLEVKNQGISPINQSLLSQISNKNDVIATFITSMVDLMHTAVEASTTKKRLALEQKIKQTIINTANDNFWNELRTHLDNSHNGIITKIFDQHPNLKEKDIKFLELMCCNFSYIEIAIILGYAPNYISKKRMILAKKLDLNIPLSDYLNQLMNDNLA